MWFIFKYFSDVGEVGQLLSSDINLKDPLDFSPFQAIMHEEVCQSTDSPTGMVKIFCLDITSEKYYFS
jgi:hypothetical protein